MTAGDDNHDDDAQLRQLRAVWVSMRDEEPPDRGLAALMSAAREKAAELEHAASPSWWQRVLATLRRPPVLALATVTLLLGGALLVTQRSAKMQADAVVETDERTSTPVSASGPTARYEPSVGGVEAAGSAAVASGPGNATVDRGEQELVRPAEVVPERPKLREAKPSKVKSTAAATTAATTTATDDVVPRKGPPPDPGATSPAGPPRGAGDAGGGAPPTLSIARDPDPVEADSAPTDQAATVKATPKKPIARTAPPSIEGEDRKTEKDSVKQAPASLDQLVKQCETAAARGDCAAARLIAQKIYTTFPAAYKARVANNAAIHRCLPSAADNAASE